MRPGDSTPCLPHVYRGAIPSLVIHSPPTGEHMGPEDVLFAAFSSELEKIAEASERAKELGAGVTAAAVVRRADRHIWDATMPALERSMRKEKGMKWYVPPSRLRKGNLAKAMGIDGPVVWLPGTGSHAGLGHKSDGARLTLVTSPYGSDVLAHELGHASNYQNKLLRFIQAGRPHQRTAIAAASAAALLVDPESPAAAAPVLLGVAPTAGVALEEALASLKGLRGLKRIGASDAAVRAYRKRMTKAWLSYAYPVPALAAVPAAILGARRLVRGAGRRKKAAKTPPLTTSRV
jgi:hypothetical protein